MLSYVIVGSGYRAEYFARIARNYPHMFRALFLLRDRRRNWTAELAPDTVQDEFAVASMLLDMGDEKAEPYPLADALEDTYYWLMFKRAMEHPGEEIHSEKMPWHAGR